MGLWILFNYLSLSPPWLRARKSPSPPPPGASVPVGTRGEEKDGRASPQIFLSSFPRGRQRRKRDEGQVSLPPLVWCGFTVGERGQTFPFRNFERRESAELASFQFLL